ncbi:MAG: ComEC/Rec2 family competence protein [Oligoflexia bacterium]|nr:ComEC/Rec2 family competence protein [Oligoflexia bacterium]
MFGFIFLLLSFFFLDLSALSSEVHEICLNQLNFKSSLSGIYKALVCGKRLPSGEIKQLFVKGGLVHLTVVSGAHLIFLENLWLKLPLPKTAKSWGLSLFLILYALASQLHPPVLRALFSFFLCQFSQKWKLFWSPAGITLLSALFCLIYNKDWIDSSSLQLSVLACLVYSISKSSLKKAFFIYLSLLPILNRWQNLHPLSVLINWTLAPIIGGLLFPLSFLSPFFPFLYKISDFLWLNFLKLLEGVKFLPSDKPLINYQLPEDWTWFYILLIFFVLSAFKKLRRGFH